MNTLLQKQNIAIALSLLFVATLSVIASVIAQQPSIKVVALSPLIIGILIGMGITNTGLKTKLPSNWQSGFNISSKTILRIAIVLYGFRLTLQDLSSIGWQGMLLATFIVISTLLVGFVIGTKWLKLDRDTALLISAGSAICGAAAVLATEPVLKAQAYKACLAVTTVVVFGCAAMVLYPFCYQLGVYGLTEHQMGLYLGATLHEVAHVVAAGKAISNDIANTAVIEKMFRVILLAPFLLVLRWLLLHVNKQQQSTSNSSNIAIPWFAVFFIVVILFNTLGVLPSNIVSLINQLDTFLLTMAMTALGLNTAFNQFKHIGLKPFYLALLLFIWLICAGFIATKLFN